MPTSFSSARPHHLGLIAISSLCLFLSFFAPCAHAAPQAVGIAVGGDNRTRLLWNNTDGSSSVWTLNTDTTVAAMNAYGPFPGWTANAIAVGSNSATRLLWNHASDNQMSLWNTTDASPTSTCLVYGPYSGWSGKALAVGANNSARLLWDNTGGPLSLWNFSDANPSATCLIYGPYSGWSGQAIAAGADNKVRILWDNTNGQISLWNQSDPNPTATCLTYGPYSGWTGQALAVGPNNVARMLWTNPSGQGQVSLWNFADASPSATCYLYTNPSGYTAVGITVGTDNLVRLLWSGSGTAQIWTIAANSTYTSKTYSVVPALASIAISPASATLNTGNTQQFTAIAKDQNGNALSPQPTIAWTYTGIGTITTAGFYSAGTIAGTATVTAKSGNVSGNAAVTVNLLQTGASGSYDVVASPVNVDAVESASGTVTAATVIGVSSVNSFTGNVQLAFSGLPSGVSAVLSSPTVSLASGIASSNLAFTIASTTRPGFYAVDVRATSGSITRSAPVNLTIYPAAQAANFTIAQDVDGLEIEPGGSDTVTLTLNPNAGFNGVVNLSLQDDPANPIVNATGSGISATFSAPSLSSSGQTSTVTFQVGAQVPENAYHLLIKGTSPTGTQTLVVTVFVLPSVDSTAPNDNVTPDGGSSSPPYPLASSASDIVRYDLDNSSNVQSQISPSQTNSDLGINFDSASKSGANDNTIHPNYLGATDDRIYVKTESPSFSYPYSAVCKIVAYTSTGKAYGTGTLIGENHVLTAAHVLYDNSGHLAYRIFVYPAWDNGISRVYHHAEAKAFFITHNFEALVAANPTSQDPLYDDYALIDLNPVVGATRADRGKGLGDKAQYMIVADDFISPDQNSFIAGYPDFVNNVYKNSNYMYFSGVGIGDDGPVLDYNNSGPYGSPEQSDNEVFYTIDTSNGDSGAAIYHPDQVTNDLLLHLYAIARAQGSPGTKFNSGTLITTTRKNLIKMQMQQDKDDVAY